MERADDCRRYAAECLMLAQLAKNPNDRAKLLEIAHAWNELAIKLAAEGDREQR